MATGKRQNLQAPPARRGRRIALWLAVLAAALLAWFWQPLNGKAGAAAAYGARVGCACRFVAGRPLDACRADFMPGMETVVLSEDVQAKSVTARYFPFST